MKELYVLVNNFGFCFYLNERSNRNLMSPQFLNFFKEGERGRIIDNPSKRTFTVSSKEAFTEPIDLIHNRIFSNVYKLTNKSVIKCNDNKFRRCQGVRFCFEFNGIRCNEIFFIDPSLWSHSKVHVQIGSSLGKKLMNSQQNILS